MMARLVDKTERLVACGESRRNFSGVWEGVCWIFVVRRESANGHQCKKKKSDVSRSLPVE